MLDNPTVDESVLISLQLIKEDVEVSFHFFLHRRTTAIRSVNKLQIGYKYTKIIMTETKSLLNMICK